MRFKFNKTYFISFAVLLIIEATIAIFLKEGFIRHTFGDFLVVILMYCFLKSFWNANAMKVALTVLAISFLVEFLQLFQLLKFLHLEHNQVAKLVLGSTFQISDLIAYTIGIIVILIMEYKILPWIRKLHSNPSA